MASHSLIFMINELTGENMSAKKSGVAAEIRELIQDDVIKLGYDLWDVEYVKEGSYKYLRITIDSENGIDIDDCTKVHEHISPIIDERDPIDEQYFLEVSSPGIERELKKPEHFDKYIGEYVVCKLFKASNGSKQHIGILEEYDAEGKKIVITEDGEKVTFDFAEVSNVNVYYDFDNENFMEEIK